jgi:hypothetical protein
MKASTRNADRLVRAIPEAVDELIVRVLGQAHQRAVDRDAPNEARTILDVAHSFADELATRSPEFDRLQFITAATMDPSRP